MARCGDGATGARLDQLNLPNRPIKQGHSFELHGFTAACGFRYAPQRPTAPWPLPRRIEELGQAAARVRMLLLHRRLACADHRLREFRRNLAERHEHGGGLAGRRGQPELGHAVHPVAGARACRAAPLAVDDLSVGLAGAGAVVQGTAAEPAGQEPRHLRLSWLSAAAGGGHSAVPRRTGAGRGRPAAAYRIRPRRGAPLQSPLRP